MAKSPRIRLSQYLIGTRLIISSSLKQIFPSFEKHTLFNALFHMLMGLLGRDVAMLPIGTYRRTSSAEDFATHRPSIDKQGFHLHVDTLYDRYD